MNFYKTKPIVLGKCQEDQGRLDPTGTTGSTGTSEAELAKVFYEEQGVEM